MKRKIWGTVIVLSIVAVVVGNVVKSRGGTSHGLSWGSPRGVSVEVEPVSRGMLDSWVSAPGEIRPETEVKIIARVSARIEQIPFREGARVERGEVLVRLDSTYYDSQLQLAEAELRSSRSEVLQAEVALADVQRNLEQNRKLADEGIISREELDASESALTLAEARLDAVRERVDQAAARVRSAGDELAQTTIRSPIDGVVAQVNSEVGEVVTGALNTPGTVMLTVADLSTMLVEAEVDESDVLALEVGQHTEVLVESLGDEVLEGALERVGVVATKANFVPVFKVRVRVDDPRSRLKPGMTAHVKIRTQTREDALHVPLQAVQQRQRRDLPDSLFADRQEGTEPDPEDWLDVVFVARDGKALATPVKVGITSDLDAEIVEGLDQDRQVIVGPLRILEDLDHDEAIQIESGKDEEDG